MNICKFEKKQCAVPCRGIRPAAAVRAWVVWVLLSWIADPTATELCVLNGCGRVGAQDRPPISCMCMCIYIDMYVHVCVFRWSYSSAVAT